MIRVNLIGSPQKAAGGGRKGIGLPTNLLPVVWVAIVLGAAAAGWFWRAGLIEESAGLSTQIATATAQRDQLQGVIDENEVFEARREALQLRVDTIANLQRNQVSPVVVLDQLSLAIGQVDYVWLSSLTHTNTTINLAGTGTSTIAIADFITSLENTGYFRNINLGSVQVADGGRFSFNLTCTFVPPPLPQEEPGQVQDENPEGADAAENDSDGGNG